MTASSVRVAAVALMAAVLSSGSCLAVGHADAQESGPIRLFPAPDEGWGASPLPPGATPPVSPPQSVPSQPTRPAKGGIQTVDVGAINPESTGVLDAGRGGLPFEMWNKSDRAAVLRALDALATSAPSPARQDLARRLLVSVAAAPSGTSSPNLVQVRVAKLMEMGAVEDVQALVRAVPAEALTPDLEQAGIESLLIDARDDEACGKVMDGLASHPQPFWQQASAYCQFRAGKAEQANLAVTLLREQGPVDPVFLWAAEQMAGLKSAPPKSLDKPSPLVLAMMRTLKRGVPQTVLAEASPWMARALAFDAGTEPGIRLGAVLKALMQGALSGAEAAKIYEAEALPAKAFEPSLVDVVRDAAPNAEAVLWQTFKKRAGQPVAQAEVALRALSLAEKRGTIPATAQVYADSVSGLQRTPDLIWFAEPAARLLLAAGKFEAASAWGAFASATPGAQGDQARAALGPLLHLAGIGGERSGDDALAQWKQGALERAKLAKTDQPAERRVAAQQTRLLGLTQALGQAVPAQAWAALWENSIRVQTALPPLPLWQTLVGATVEGRTGETVALALAALGDKPSFEVADLVLAQAVDSLRRVGQVSAARRIAVEAALVSGL